MDDVVYVYVGGSMCMEENLGVEGLKLRGKGVEYLTVEEKAFEGRDFSREMAEDTLTSS